MVSFREDKVLLWSSNAAFATRTPRVCYNAPRNKPWEDHSLLAECVSPHFWKAAAVGATRPPIGQKVVEEGKGREAQNRAEDHYCRLQSCTTVPSNPDIRWYQSMQNNLTYYNSFQYAYSYTHHCLLVFTWNTEEKTNAGSWHSSQNTCH